MTTQEEEDKTQAEGEGGEDSKKGSEKDEAEEVDDDEDDYQHRVFYRKEEILTAHDMQARDMFDDIQCMRQESLAELDQTMFNKFNILDFTPKAKVDTPVTKTKKRTGLTKSKKVGDIPGFDEEEEDPNFDEFLADFEKKKKEKETNEMTELKLHEMEKTNLEHEIKQLIKQRDTNSPDSSQASRASRQSKTRSQNKARKK